MFMKSLNVSELTSELLDLPADTKIDLHIYCSFCSFANYNYICSADDALAILHIFATDYSFQYKIL